MKEWREWQGVPVPSVAPSFAFNTNPDDLAVKWPPNFEAFCVRGKDWKRLGRMMSGLYLYRHDKDYGDFLFGTYVIVTEKNVPPNYLRHVWTDRNGNITGVADSAVFEEVK
jgi:hypothetical protein